MCILISDIGKNNWRDCISFKDSLEVDGFKYSKLLEKSLIEQMKINGSLTLRFHVFKLAS